LEPISPVVDVLPRRLSATLLDKSEIRIRDLNAAN